MLFVNTFQNIKCKEVLLTDDSGYKCLEETHCFYSTSEISRFFLCSDTKVIFTYNYQSGALKYLLVLSMQGTTQKTPLSSQRSFPRVSSQFSESLRKKMHKAVTGMVQSCKKSTPAQTAADEKPRLENLSFSLTL